MLHVACIVKVNQRSVVPHRPVLKVPFHFLLDRLGQLGRRIQSSSQCRKSPPGRATNPSPTTPQLCDWAPPAPGWCFLPTWTGVILWRQPALWGGPSPLGELSCFTAGLISQCCNVFYNPACHSTASGGSLQTARHAAFPLRTPSRRGGKPEGLLLHSCSECGLVK